MLCWVVAAWAPSSPPIRQVLRMDGAPRSIGGSPDVFVGEPEGIVGGDDAAFLVVLSR